MARMARMGQRLPRNEFGFAVFKTPAGGFMAGPVSTGTPTSVDIAVACPECPPGSSFYALIHSHPGGVAFPSAQDIQSAMRLGNARQCILSDNDFQCFQTRGQ